MIPKIPFSLPYIDQYVKKEIDSVLNDTGWLTSGPKVKLFEDEISKLNNVSNTVCVNSWTSAAMLMLRWFGVGIDDEVIIPSYTYSATALCVLNIGAKPVMVDVLDDFTIDPNQIKDKINNNTKAIIPVDIGGLPCDYAEINKIISCDSVTSVFRPKSVNQKKLGRILIIGDAAHSIGATYKSLPIARATDMSLFSFHSVKNITTGEGGAISLNLPNEIFDSNKVYKDLKILALNGQTKSAFQKNQVGGWKYDIVNQGLKINMPDICAAIGLAQIKIYTTKLLPERKKIFKFYDEFFSKYDWAIIPPSKEINRESSYHLYMLRIKGFTELKRDKLIDIISSKGVAVNVHYIPMPLLTLFSKLGYLISNYPNTLKLYSNEISLPVYNNLSFDNLKYICKVILESKKIIDVKI